MEQYGYVPSESLDINSEVVSGELSQEPRQKHRGRPHGSRNKVRGPVIITQETETGSMKPVVLEIPPGEDVIHCLMDYAATRHVGVTILSGSGTLSSVAIRQPGFTGPPFVIEGEFTMLSLTGTYIGYNAPIYATMSSASCFGICISGLDCQVFGGIVGSGVIAGSPVVLVVATFVNPNFHRLIGNYREPVQEQYVVRGGGSGGGIALTNLGLSDVNFPENASASMPLTTYDDNWLGFPQPHY